MLHVKRRPCLQGDGNSHGRVHRDIGRTSRNCPTELLSRCVSQVSLRWWALTRRESWGRKCWTLVRRSGLGRPSAFMAHPMSSGRRPNNAKTCPSQSDPGWGPPSTRQPRAALGRSFDFPVSEQKLDRGVLNLPPRRPGPDPARRLFARIAWTPNSTRNTRRSSLDDHLRPLGMGSIVRSASRSKCIVLPEPRETIGAS